MVSVDKAYLISIMPEFAAADAAVVTALNGPARLSVSEATFGDAAKYALALVIAHMLKLSELRGGGQITSKHVGGISISQSAPSNSGTGWGASSYGARFEDLCRQYAVPMVFIAPASTWPVGF